MLGTQGKTEDAEGIKGPFEIRISRRLCREMDAVVALLNGELDRFALARKSLRPDVAVGSDIKICFHCKQRAEWFKVEELRKLSTSELRVLAQEQRIFHLIDLEKDDTDEVYLLQVVRDTVPQEENEESF